MTTKFFTLAEASAQLEPIRDQTRAADERLQQLKAELATADPSLAAQLNARINATIQHWAEGIMQLGALPKGLWTVDFDSGQGYYFCWALNEPNVGHYHAYEDGFAGRKPLGEFLREEHPPVLN